MERSLWDTIKRLTPLAPNFVSVTYGAGGSTRERTHSTIARILAETDLTPAAHLTCVGAARARSTTSSAAITTSASATSWRCAAIPPAASAPPMPRIPTATGLRPTSSPASSGSIPTSRCRSPPIRKAPRKPDFDADIDVLQAKVDAGATRAITQVFFDNDLYLRYLDRVRARGIAIPIVPGIMPMHNFKQARNFVTRAGTSVPDWLAEKFEGLDDDAETRKLVAATVAADQVRSSPSRASTPSISTP